MFFVLSGSSGSFSAEPLCESVDQCLRSRSRSPWRRPIFTPIVWIEDRENLAVRDRKDRDLDLDLDLRSFPLRSNNASALHLNTDVLPPWGAVSRRLLRLQVPLLHHRVLLHSMYHVIVAMCNIKCRALCCVVAVGLQHCCLCCALVAKLAC